MTASEKFFAFLLLCGIGMALATFLWTALFVGVSVPLFLIGL